MDGLKPNTVPSKVPYIADLLAEKINCLWLSLKHGFAIIRMSNSILTDANFFKRIGNESSERQEEDLVGVLDVTYILLCRQATR